MSNEETIRNEQTFLRTELQELKRCQLNYFVLSVAGGGAILALGDGFPVNGDAKAVVFLAPLVIVLPCWLTFFDKATTITRLVGYIRVAVEEQLAQGSDRYLGYETALARFRREEASHPSTLVVKFKHLTWRNHWKPLLRLRERHQYWMINWYTFLAISLLSCVLPIVSLLIQNHVVPWWLYVFEAGGLLASFVVGVFTFRSVLELTYGKSSYDHVADYWRGFLFSKTG